MKTILFDIDGTLLKGNRAGHEAFVNAIRICFGIEDSLERIVFAGGTDRLLIKSILETHRVPATEERIQRFFEELPKQYKAVAHRYRFEPCRGAGSLLGSLSRESGYSLGLATGNIESCAWLKLEMIGLDGFFDFGGFGDEHDHRHQIVRSAFKKSPHQHQPAVLIGDTPSDIKAAQENGFDCIAVATGKFNQSELHALGPTLAIDHLEMGSVSDYFTSVGR